jgi:NADPH:quinone reductase-like Zn-dependent oxidoreductase
MMGGMGRTFDGGYAEYTCVPAAQVIPLHSTLDWATLGAIPEMLQTAYGSLTVGLDMQPGQSLLIRGGTSSVGMAAAVLAKDHGLIVLSTTRRPDRSAALTAIGVDHVLIDDGEIAPKVRTLVPAGVEVALELVGTPTLPDTLRATAIHGVVCFTGMLSNQWTVKDFYPIGYLPSGVRLTAYGGEAADLPSDVLQSFLDAVAAGRLTVPLYRTYTLDEIQVAQTSSRVSHTGRSMPFLSCHAILVGSATLTTSSICILRLPMSSSVKTTLPTLLKRVHRILRLLCWRPAHSGRQNT